MEMASFRALKIVLCKMQRQSDEKSSYSTKVFFAKEEAESLKQKAIEFVNKVKNIVESNKK